MNLLVIADPGAPHLRLLDRLPQDVRVTIAPTASALEAQAPRAEAVLVTTGRNDVLRELWPAFRNLRWIHSLSAGVEGILFPDLVASDVAFTNARGVYKQSLAEFAIAAMLFFAKDLRRMTRNQVEARWEQFDVAMLAGATLGIIGYGEIARATARLAKPFGMRILAVRRRAAPDDLADEVFGMEERVRVIAESDYLLVAAPLTPGTRGLIGVAEIAAMKPAAVLINLGRGPVVDEAALVEALEDRRIGGAALDVFDQEPLPAEHPFWRLDNVLLSPHTADHTATWLDETVEFFLRNFELWAAGQPLENVVDKEAGY